MSVGEGVTSDDRGKVPEADCRVTRLGVVMRRAVPSEGTTANESGFMVRLLHREAREDEPTDGSAIVGDPFDSVGSDRDSITTPWMGNASVVQWSKADGLVRVRSSLSGLPPMLLLDTPLWIGVVSDIELLTSIPGPPLHFDRQGIVDLCTIGHPIDHRTLFRGIRVVPAGVELLLDGRGWRITQRWEPEDMAVKGRAEFLDRQMSLFDAAIDALDVEDSLLSLSGGLDSRAVLSGLLRRGVRARCFTVSGVRPSLDACIAGKLCAAVGSSHQLVTLSDAFTDSLWELSLRASRQSNGLCGVLGAPQVYCYDQLPVDHRRPGILSGDLGNQVGRGAHEVLSQRGVDTAILHQEFGRVLRLRRDKAPWHTRGRAEGAFDRRFLVQEESLFASSGTYALGHRRAVQQHPYAWGRLIESACSAGQWTAERKTRAFLSPTAREFAWRFVGPGSFTFQGGYIARLGGPPAEIPINWGWKPSGGISLRGIGSGVLAFTEEVVRHVARGHPYAESVLELSGLRGFATHLDGGRWVRTLKEPVFDLLGSAVTKESGLFDLQRTRTLAEDFFQGRQPRPATVLAIADLLLLLEGFGSVTAGPIARLA